MDTGELRQFLHSLNNALNAAKINAYILHKIHGTQLDTQAGEGLDSALSEAEQLIVEFHRRVHACEAQGGHAGVTILTPGEQS